MSGHQGENLPERPDAAAVPRVGVDEWVASHEGRTRRRGGPLAPLVERAARVPWWVWLLVVVGLAAFLPGVTDSDYIVRVGLDTATYALLALGLNVVVGYAGLLDLGYVAFFGFGAYMYAFLSSEQFGIHWPTEVVIPLVVLASAVLGLLLGLPSRRLLGDYLAIVTLFFAQIFVVLTTNANRVTLPWNDGPSDITGGPNGIASIDQMSIFGIEIDSVQRYYWLALVFFGVVVTVLFLVDRSRTGRAWKALREDPLAAEAMTIPVNRLKLTAFMFGAGIAGLAGTLLAAVQVGVFPQNFDVPLLITIYSMVILGGAGSIVGVVIGAFIINVSQQLLEQPNDSRIVFYVAIAAIILWRVRPLWRIGALAGAVVAFGFAVRGISDAVWERGTKGQAVGDDVLGRALDAWVLTPTDPKTIANVFFVVLIAGVLTMTLLKGWPRLVLAVPLIYVAAFVWENRLATEPSFTRLLVLGALLVGLMTARPQGLFGTARVEIV
jgi:branched-chain amino acid transport system permease protein